MQVDFGQLELRLGLPDLALGLGHLRLRLFQLPLRLIERGLKRTRIDLEQQLALRDLGTFAIFLANKVAAYLRLDLCVYVPIERSNPVAD
jgi:hypothetical protein